MLDRAAFWTATLAAALTLLVGLGASWALQGELGGWVAADVVPSMVAAAVYGSARRRRRAA